MHVGLKAIPYECYNQRKKYNVLCYLYLKFVIMHVKRSLLFRSNNNQSNYNVLVRFMKFCWISKL